MVWYTKLKENIDRLVYLLCWTSHQCNLVVEEKVSVRRVQVSSPNFDIVFQFPRDSGFILCLASSRIAGLWH